MFGTDCNYRQPPPHPRLGGGGEGNNAPGAHAPRNLRGGVQREERKGKREREGEREREGREIRRHPLRQGVPALPAPPPRALQQGAEVPI